MLELFYDLVIMYHGLCCVNHQNKAERTDMEKMEKETERNSSKENERK